jgi:hypothetical protein
MPLQVAFPLPSHAKAPRFRARLWRREPVWAGSIFPGWQNRPPRSPSPPPELVFSAACRVARVLQAVTA